LQHKAAGSQGNAAAAAAPTLIAEAGAAAAAAGASNGADQRVPGPLVLGISAPQGCGKTTLCEELKVSGIATLLAYYLHGVLLRCDVLQMILVDPVPTAVHLVVVLVMVFTRARHYVGKRRVRIQPSVAFPE